ncbi:MAG: phosphate signaling complex protein PhoU [Methylococcaceae bacterium]|nr:phosphate signaling complex protein PhoU [Methylococcaceae bacterium]
MQLGKHISQRFTQNLEDIRNKVLVMGGLVESQADNAVKSLLEANAELAEEVSISDYKVNKMEVAIDEQCVQVIARNQPAASDLRLVIAVVKVITDLERIGDEAEKIGRESIKLAKYPTVNQLHAELSHLSQLVLGMLHDALDAFARMDTELALKIVANGDLVNKEYNNLSRLLITHMMEDPRNIKSVLRVTWCARSLERIGDHSRNICEYVVYFVKGKDIRHTSLDEVLADHFPGEMERKI